MGRRSRPRRRSQAPDAGRAGPRAGTGPPTRPARRSPAGGRASAGHRAGDRPTTRASFWPLTGAASGPTSPARPSGAPGLRGAPEGESSCSSRRLRVVLRVTRPQRPGAAPCRRGRLSARTLPTDAARRGDRAGLGAARRVRPGYGAGAPGADGRRRHGVTAAPDDPEAAAGGALRVPISGQRPVERDARLLALLILGW
jgi:hypothetical protein